MNFAHQWPISTACWASKLYTLLCTGNSLESSARAGPVPSAKILSTRGDLSRLFREQETQKRSRASAGHSSWSDGLLLLVGYVASVCVCFTCGFPVCIETLRNARIWPIAELELVCWELSYSWAALHACAAALGTQWHGNGSRVLPEFKARGNRSSEQPNQPRNSLFSLSFLL